MADTRSISDDDLCGDCSNCEYDPGARSRCKLNWPGTANPDGYIVSCPEYVACESGGNFVQEG